MNVLPADLVIAHRGTTFWAPEETEAAMRWARNIGADYLELDLQRTRDGYLIALHDESLVRTTNIEDVFPDRINEPVSSFLYEELLLLDAGTWFNKACPDRARDRYTGLEILLLEDVINIAEGKKIKRGPDGKRLMREQAGSRKIPLYEDDPADNGNRPGIYAETKIPQLFPGIEDDLVRELTRMGWYHENPEMLKLIEVPGKVKVANTISRLVLQTFSRDSLQKLNQVFSGYVPKCFLLWRGDTGDDIPDDSSVSYETWLKFGVKHGATIVGPSIGGGPNNYPDLLTLWHIDIIRKYPLQIHGYSFDTWEQMRQYGNDCHGMFTNRAEETLVWYGKAKDEQQSGQRAVKALADLGY